MTLKNNKIKSWLLYFAKSFYYLDVKNNKIIKLNNLIYNINPISNFNTIVDNNSTIFCFCNDKFCKDIILSKTSNTYSTFNTNDNINKDYLCYNEQYSTSSGKFDYTSLLNIKQYSNSLIHFSNSNKQKDFYTNKLIMSNLCYDVKKIFKADKNKNLNNKQKKSNKVEEYYFSNTSPLGASNFLFLIYSLFNENSINLNIEILNEVILFLNQFQAFSVIEELVYHIGQHNNIINIDNVLMYYNFAFKHNLIQLKNICNNYRILNNINFNTVEDLNNYNIINIESSNKHSYDSIISSSMLDLLCNHLTKVIEIEVNNINIKQNNSYILDNNNNNNNKNSLNIQDIKEIVFNNKNNNNLFKLNKNKNTLKINICLECNKIIN